ncbi:WXG100 family type VII secretion target [Nonomuraea sp. NPDC050783]|uniref:WXG100 family type VII secretion target n=1 Tax=Nonomuraea sp. NPDC050783 TaxID=3154634 RepID=UPI003466A967
MGGEKKKTHMLKPSCGSWATETGGRSVEEVVTFIKGFDATRIKQAATAYKDANKAVSDAQKGIEEQARELAKVWEGNASVEAQKALGVLFLTLGELADKLSKMHEPVENLANVVRKHQAFIDDDMKGIMPTWANQGGLAGGSWNDSIPDIYSTYTGVYGGDSATGDFGSQDELAGLHLRTFANDLQHVHQQIPDSVEKVLRDISYPQPDQNPPPTVPYPKGDHPYGNTQPGPYDGSGYQGVPTGSTSGPPFGTTDPATGYPANPGYPNGTYPPGNGPGGNGPGGNGPGGGNGSGPGGNGTGASPNVPVPGGSTSPGGTNPAYNPAALHQNPAATGTNPTTSLQDFNPTSANGYNPAAGANPATHPSTGVPGYGSPSTAYPPGTAGGPGTATGGGVAGLPPNATTAATRAATSGTGMPFLPMGAGGGAGAQESEKQESTTWLHEDDDVWGSDPGSVVNSRIG